MKHRRKNPTIDLDAPRETTPRGGRMRTARSRGAVSGSLLVALGLWGAVAPFVGPTFDFGFTPDAAFDWTTGRFWMQVLPGAVALVCGLVLLATRNRAVGVVTGYLAAAAGAWFVVGPVLAVEELGSWSAIGEPLGSETRRTVEQLTMFSGLGLAIVLLSALAIGRMTVRSVDDVEAATAVRDDDAGLDIGRRTGAGLDGQPQDGGVDGPFEEGPVDRRRDEPVTEPTPTSWAPTGDEGLVDERAHAGSAGVGPAWPAAHRDVPPV